MNYIKPENIELHYTHEEMAKDLLAITPISAEDSVLDAGSGNNKVWFKNLNCKEKFECELEDGNDFYNWLLPVDWVIGNPPYNESWKFTEKALSVANKGVAWLVNNQALNSHLTPARLEKMANLGFHLNLIHVVADKRWFGRYYYLIFSKENICKVSWNKKTY